MLNKINVKERFNVCRDVFAAFNSNDIPYVVIKGAVLSKMAYGDVYQRKSCDIDILINRRDIDNVKLIMLESGFIQGRVIDGELLPFSRRELLFQISMTHQTAPFIKRTSNPLCPYVNVDVNFEIMWGESKLRVDMDYVLSDVREIEICGFIVKKLPPEMEFVALCLHHYKDMNSIYLLSQGSLKASLFEDIYNYITNVQLDFDKLFYICTRFSVSDYVYYCLHYTQELFNNKTINEYMSLIETNTSKYLLNSFGLNDNERQEWGIHFHDRLYTNNLNDYFNKHLPVKNLKKIIINRTLM